MFPWRMTIMRRLRFFFAAVKNYWTRVLRPRRQQKHALSTLGQTKGSRIDHTIGPGETEIAEASSEIPDCTASVKLKHERDVL